MVVKKLILVPVFLLIIIFITGFLISVVQTMIFVKNCEGIVLRGECLPKVDFKKPSVVVENATLGVIARDVQWLAAWNDPTITQRHNGLWDPCPPIKLPACEEY